MQPLSIGQDTVSSLRAAVNDCRDRHLLAASKWASELLLSIPPTTRLRPSQEGSPQQQLPASPDLYPRHSLAPPLHTGTLSTSSAAHDPHVHDDLRNARIYLRTREYLRVSGTLAAHLPHNPTALYLDLYSRFLSIQSDNTQEWELSENTNNGQSALQYQKTMKRLLSLAENAADPWLLYLKGLFLSHLSRREEAIECALLSIASYPWNWASWTLLSSLIGDGEELQAILPLLPLPHNHSLVHMFQIKTVTDLHTPSDHELGLCEDLLGPNFFPECIWLLSQRACILYYQHKFGLAETAFEDLLVKDPYRIDDIDLFSNVLYVTENSLRLSRLAHEIVSVETNRPEVCCLLGNHHSIRAEHEKAVKYFRRATQLDRSYISAWTLMGHEYVEMKKPQAAVAAYRNAIGVNRKDYRAWFGLGQVYELLNMHNYALYYYQHATALRPYDTRLWQAEAACYRDIGKYRDAIECLKRALIPAAEDQVSIILKLADLHNQLGEEAESTAYHRRIVEMCTVARKPVDAFAYSCLQVAEYEMKQPKGNLRLAEEYCYEVSRSNAEETTRAADMLREVNKLLKKVEEEQKAQEPASSLPEGPRQHPNATQAQQQPHGQQDHSDSPIVPEHDDGSFETEPEPSEEEAGDVSMNSMESITGSGLGQ